MNNPEDIAALICRDVAELPDRSSPEDWPEAMLVTHDELSRIVVAALSAASPAAPQEPSSDSDHLASGASSEASTGVAHPLDLLLPEICQLLDTCGEDFKLRGLWTEWDQSVRDRITAYNLNKMRVPTPRHPATDPVIAWVKVDQHGSGDVVDVTLNRNIAGSWRASGCDVRGLVENETRSAEPGRSADTGQAQVRCPDSRKPDYSICPSCGGMADDPIVPPEHRGIAAPAAAVQPVAPQVMRKDAVERMCPKCELPALRACSSDCPMPALPGSASVAAAVQSDTERDAARYRLVRRGQHWSVINGIGRPV
jgi:hypothetical protein